jgi:hypothetical protein
MAAVGPAIRHTKAKSVRALWRDGLALLEDRRRGRPTCQQCLQIGAPGAGGQGKGDEKRVTLWGRVDCALIGLIVEAVVWSRHYRQRNRSSAAQAPNIVVELVDRQTGRCANRCCGIGSSMMASYDLCGCGKPIFIVPGRSASD